jgi:hypothetical protein
MPRSGENTKLDQQGIRSAGMTAVSGIYSTTLSGIYSTTLLVGRRVLVNIGNRALLIYGKVSFSLTFLRSCLPI